MGDYLEMAKKGSVYLFGDGQLRLNPIHGEDLANVILDELHQSQKEIEVGGPDILTQKEIAQLALAAYGKTRKINHLPSWLRTAAIWTLRRFTPQEFHGPYEFFLTMMADDQIAPRYGVRRLRNHFTEEVNQLKKS
jgi:uncharacterized protein YbjT (DUF2867 family)